MKVYLKISSFNWFEVWLDENEWSAPRMVYAAMTLEDALQSASSILGRDLFIALEAR